MERLPETPRHVALDRLSRERGRSLEHPLDPSLISKWCADLGFQARLSFFNEDQMQQLSAINLHYARGGNRRELLDRMRGNPTWYA
jgi:hypothetical protein